MVEQSKKSEIEFRLMKRKVLFESLAPNGEFKNNKKYSKNAPPVSCFSCLIENLSASQHGVK